MTVTEAFGKNWKPGIDCRIAAFRNSLACKNVFLSNPMVLGLSGSYVFCFNDGTKHNRSPYFALVGLTDNSLEGLANRLNCYLLKGRATIEADIVKQLSPYFSYGLPVSIGVKRFRMKQIVSETDGSPTNLIGEDNGFHFVTLTGYNKAARSFDMFDTDTMQLREISKELLEEVWFYDLKFPPAERDQFQSCDGQWFAVEVGEMNAELIIKGAVNAIEKVLLNFFHSPVPEFIGKEALLKFKSFAHSWAQSSPDSSYFCGCLQLMQLMEAPLSGGGFGRKLYGYFLRELSELLKDNELKEISVLFSETAREWKKFVSGLLETISKDGNMKIDFTGVGQVTERYAEKLVESEIQQMEALSDWVKLKSVNSITRYATPSIA